MGAEYSRTRLSPKVLLLIIHSTAHAAHPSETKVGTLVFARKYSGGLRRADESSDTSSSATTLSGSRSKHSVPVMTSVTASDSGNQAGMRNGDRLHMKLKQRTNVSFETKEVQKLTAIFSLN